MKPILQVLFTLMVSFCNAQIGIGTATPNKNAALDITSPNKGLLLPRVTDTGVVTDPSAGLLIYNLATKSPNFHNGTNWNALSKTSATLDLDSITYTITGGPTGYTNGTFNCLSVQNGILNSGGGVANFQDVSIAKEMDINSTAFAKGVPLGLQSGSGSFIIEILFYKKSTTTPYYSVKLTECMITSYQLGASNSGSMFQEQISIKPTKYGFKNWVNNLSFGWDVAMNKLIPY